VPRQDLSEGELRTPAGKPPSYPLRDIGDYAQLFAAVLAVVIMLVSATGIYQLISSITEVLIAGTFCNFLLFVVRHRRRPWTGRVLIQGITIVAVLVVSAGLAVLVRLPAPASGTDFGRTSPGVSASVVSPSHSANPSPSTSPSTTPAATPTNPSPSRVPPGSQPPSQQPAPVVFATTKTIDARVWPGVDTGVVLASGQIIHVVQTGGSWNCDDTSPFKMVGAGGDPNYPYNSDHLAVPYATYCSLVGRIGQDGAWQEIGTSETFTAGQAGALYLAPNDVPPDVCNPPSEPGGAPTSCYTDNHGALTVRISS